MPSIISRGACTLALCLFFALLSYCQYKISGRATLADGVRPFIALFLWWQAALLCYRLRHALLARAISLLTALSALITVLFFVYYRRIDSFITGDDMVAIIQSNPEERWDFMIFNILTPAGLATALAAALLSLTLFEISFNLQRRRVGSNPARQVRGRRRLSYALLALFFFAGGAGVISQLRPVKFYFIMRQQYFEQIEVFNQLSAKVENVSATEALKEQQGELYVLVIGESLNRDFMGCYNGVFDTTPFLNRLCAQDGTVKFANAYAAFVNTVPALTHAFSEGNFASGLTFPRGDNLFAVLRRAGVKSAWISNQVRQSRFDTPIAALADKTDFQYFSINASEGSSKQQRPDEYLLPVIESYLKEQAPQDNHLLVIHLMGNHSPYANRYPADFAEYDLSDPALIGSCASSFGWREELNQYLTSIRYNDRVLEQIYALCAERPDFAGFIYLSDHAEEITPPGGRHNMGQFTYTMTRVPLIVNLSERYVRAYPETLQALQHNAGKLFINDALYDLMLSLMQVKSSAFDPGLSPACPGYAPDELRGPIDGGKDVREDPLYQAQLNLSKLQQDRLAGNAPQPLPEVVISDPSCLYELAQSQLCGAQYFKFAASLEEEQGVVLRLQQGRQLGLKDLLQAVPSLPEGLILDFAGHAELQALRTELEALQQAYPALQLWVMGAGELDNVQLSSCTAAPLPPDPDKPRLTLDCKLKVQEKGFAALIKQLPAGAFELVGTDFVSQFDEQD